MGKNTEIKLVGQPILSQVLQLVENAIRTQVWCTLIAQLLLTVLQKKAKVSKAFSTVATMVRIHLVSMLDVYELLRNVKRTWAKQTPDSTPTLSLFPT